MFEELWIVMGSDGFPIFEDAELSKMRTFRSRIAAVEYAMALADESPMQIISVFKLDSRWFNDGLVTRPLDARAQV